MNLSAGRRTWEEAQSPAAVRLARSYEQEWRDAKIPGHKPDLRKFLEQAALAPDAPGIRLALFRADMTLRWDTGGRVDAQWYLDHFGGLDEDTAVALIYEEYCLKEEDQENPDPTEYYARYPQVASALGRVLEIHALVGSGTVPTTLSLSSSTNGIATPARAFPDAGETIADFTLVEELGRGAFARVFLAKERELADRPVALKVSRRGSREPQTLARLQHTHIVPVHSHRIDAASGLHLLCMPYFGRITLARVLADPFVQSATSGVALAEALDRLDAAGDLPAGRAVGRLELAKRPYSRAIAWWCARLAEALAHAHDRGVLHRDIKPSNVLVTSDGMPMLLDFNLAREPLPEDGTAADTSTLGGTIDYMAPEHLRALGDPSAPVAIDGRADIYGLGVMLFEAVTGQRPFVSPRRGSSVIEALEAAIDQRLRPLPPVRHQHPEIPRALDAVICRCLAPNPASRYQTAAELAGDLQAIADDLPLSHAREPWLSRATGWVRRRRRLLVMAAFVLFATLSAGAFGVSVVNQRSKDFERVKLEYQRGEEAAAIGDYRTSKVHFDNAADLAEHASYSFWEYWLKLKNVRNIGSLVVRKLKTFDTPMTLEEYRTQALEKSQLADRTDQTRNEADAFFEAADGLRFRLELDERDELPRTFEDLQKAILPFYVLKSDDWTKLDHILILLDAKRRARIIPEVNELLFLWMVQIDEGLETRPDASDPRAVIADRDAALFAIKICEKALVWAEPKTPWLVMRSRFLARQATRSAASRRLDPRNISPVAAEPASVSSEHSPLACFQWGLLASRDQRLPRAMEWLRRATQLESNNHWYQYFLAYLEDRAGSMDEALRDYSVAIATRPNSPWVRFSRARLYRAKGRWDFANEDLTRALEMLAGRPEAAKVELELGYLYYELGNFPGARREFNNVIRTNLQGPYGPAARLNLANINAESGAIDQARQEYDALLAEDFGDTSARLSRALLELRQRQAERALVDCDTLLKMGKALKNQGDVLTARAMALLLLNRSEEAIADATSALRAQPSPTRERLRQRMILAARRFDLLQLDDPAEINLLPVGGDRLAIDLRAAAQGLERLARGNPRETFRASLTLAVILAAQSRHAAAVEAASWALRASPYAPRAYLIRARVQLFAGSIEGARADVERGLAIQFNEPGLLELRGVLHARDGDHRAALEDFDTAIAWGARDGVHQHKAAALVALGRDFQAVQEWSLALRRDPELAEAYLGRARSHIKLGQWDMALADLEQAASWANSDFKVELGIVVPYFQCLRTRPERVPRFLAVALRAATDLWGSIATSPIR